MNGVIRLPLLTLLLAFTGAGICPAGAADTANPALSAVSGMKRGAWQQHLTLGPGDLINISLFNAPDSAQKDMPIGPDGKISFLQARDVLAAGLTLDELRAKLDEALGRFYQNPRTIVTPSSFRSKRYFVLGAVLNKGVFTLDQPLTVIEALARAGGLETGVFDRNTVELCDLTHSFLVRNGKRVAVDFEHLFQRGDLTQNIAIEPEDYLYFALASANEIYVFGEVTYPGTAAFLPRSTVIGAIASRGGYTQKAFRSRVLVARGNLNQPQCFVVDTSAIMKGKTPDFQLQPKDIVYVSKSPWAKAEEIIDIAATAFITGVTVGTVTRKVGPIFTEPIIK